MKRIVIAIFSLIICISLVACGAKGGENTSVKTDTSVKDIEQIIEDLEAASVPKESKKTVNITNLEIIKRQTNVDEMQDTVFVTMTGESDVAKFIRSYCLKYTLYNEGWILDTIDNYSEGEHATEPLVEPNDSLVDEFFAQYNNETRNYNSQYEGYGKYNYLKVSNPEYVSWEIDDGDYSIEENKGLLAVIAHRELPTCTTNEYIILPFSFSDSGEWFIELTGNAIDSMPNMIQSIEIDWGKLAQYGTISNGSTTLQVSDYDVDYNILTFSYSNDYQGEYFNGSCTLNSKYDLYYDYQSALQSIQIEINDYNKKEQSNMNMDSTFKPMAPTSLYLAARASGNYHDTEAVENHFYYDIIADIYDFILRADYVMFYDAQFQWE